VILFLTAGYFRKKYSPKYGERFIQSVEYRKLNRKERRGKEGHKYEMLIDRTEYTKLTGFRISHKYFELYKDGRLVIKKGYRWDGPSGPTVDTASFMRGSAIHDVFFQCMRENLFMFIKVKWESWGEVSNWRHVFNLSNKELKRFCIEDGMMWPRYHWVYYAVQKAGAKNARPTEKKSDYENNF